MGGDARRPPVCQRLRIRVAPGRIVAVVGPSGAGKTLLLRAIRRVVPDAIVVDPGAVAASVLPAVGFLDAPRRRRGRRTGDTRDLAARLEVLSRCGLAEAGALVSPARRLSAGQQYRLALARAIWRACRSRRPRLLLADEFGATLDATTARVVASQLPKLARRWGLGVILATPREELLGLLKPAGVIVKPLDEPAVMVEEGAIPAPRPGGRVEGELAIEPGRIADYRALARFHYLSAPPAAHKRVWVVRRKPAGSGAWAGASGPEVAAVLVVSPPVLHCRGRNQATRGRYLGPDRRRAVRLLNAEVECISRVIVHPVFRGLGLAVRLVRHALRTAGTPLVEALATMSAVHPFFQLAGMTLYGRFAGRGRAYSYCLAPAPGACLPRSAPVPGGPSRQGAGRGGRDWPGSDRGCPGPMPEGRRRDRT